MPGTDTLYEIACPHCKKQFEAQLIDGTTARHRGFKCPKCKLFVPYERVEAQALAQPAT